MNLRSIANAATQTINPNTPVTVKTSMGYSINPFTRKQEPTYSITTGFANIQALDGKDLQHVSGLNIQGTLRKAYLYGNLAGVIQPDSRGGDLIEFDKGQWLVVKVIETWPDWCSVAINYQGPIKQ